MNKMLLATALLISALATPALAGDPETCRYDDARLAQACRTDPGVKAFLMEPRNIGVNDLEAVPTSIRGWMPGEEAAVIRRANQNVQAAQDGCAFDSRIVTLACQTNDTVRARLIPVGAQATLYNLPWYVGGYAPSVLDGRQAFINPDSAVMKFRLSDNYAREANAEAMEAAISRGVGEKVAIVSLYVIAVDQTNMIVCGYAFVGNTSGAFVFDTRPGQTSALRATPEMMQARCAYADAVLRVPA